MFLQNLIKKFGPRKVGPDRTERDLTGLNRIGSNFFASLIYTLVTSSEEEYIAKIRVSLVGE